MLFVLHKAFQLSFPGKRIHIRISAYPACSFYTQFPVLHSFTAFSSFFLLPCVRCFFFFFELCLKKEKRHPSPLTPKLRLSAFYMHDWTELSHGPTSPDTLPTLHAPVLLLWEGWSWRHGNQQSQMGSHLSALKSTVGSEVNESSSSTQSDRDAESEQMLSWRSSSSAFRDTTQMFFFFFSWGVFRRWETQQFEKSPLQVRRLFMLITVVKGSPRPGVETLAWRSQTCM